MKHAIRSMKQSSPSKIKDCQF